MKAPGRWMIVNRSGPFPVYFCMEMRDGAPVFAAHSTCAKELPGHASCIAVMEEWNLRLPWRPEDHTLQPRQS